VGEGVCSGTGVDTVTTVLQFGYQPDGDLPPMMMATQDTR
jgi:hypothetical protein